MILPSNDAASLYPYTPNSITLGFYIWVQSGCCKPPTSCGYTYVNETFWTPGAGLTGGTDQDCLRWSNEQERLCYSCGSCKAGVVASLKKSWRKVCTINLVILIILVVLQVITWAALSQDKKRDETKACVEVPMDDGDLMSE